MKAHPNTGMRGRAQAGLLIGLAFAAACAAALGTGWYLANAAATPAAAAGAPAAAQPPAAQPRASAAAALAAASAPARAASDVVPWPLWEFQLAQPLPERDPPRTPLPWRMIGAGRSGGKWQLIVLREGKTEPEYFAVGDSLPGNYRIAAISDEDVTLRQGRRTLILSYIGTQ